MIPDVKHFVSCSFGKDSIATILLALEHNEPLDGVVYSEVMFDHAHDISGEYPIHHDWIYNVAIPRLNKLSVPVYVLKSKDDYLSLFFHINGANSKYQGKLRGFPLGGRCIINRVCKLEPIRKFYAQFPNVIQYIGIASDEPNRLRRLNENKISLLEKYHYTEKMALDLCYSYSLLSPLYAHNTRGGCWFCPNCKFRELKSLRKEHNDLWSKLLELGKVPNLTSNGFRWGVPIEEIEQRLKAQDRQLSIDFGD